MRTLSFCEVMGTRRAENFDDKDGARSESFLRRPMTRHSHLKAAPTPPARTEASTMSGAARTPPSPAERSKEGKRRRLVSRTGAHRTLVDDDGDHNIPVEYLNGQTPTGLPPHELRLRAEMPIMVRNLEAHVNVEVCTSVNACKYLLKYIHKGGGRAMTID